MTKREFMEMVIETVDNAELKAFAESEIEKMNTRNARRASQPSRRAKENEPIKEKIVAFLTGCEERQVASVIAENVEISTQKASALCRQLVADEVITVEDVRVKGKGKQKGYAIA